MKKNEQLNDLPFTKEELEFLKFTPAELEMLRDSNALVETTKMLPENPDVLNKKLNKELPDDLNGAFLKLAELSKTDPEFVKQLVAMNELFSEVTIEDETSKPSSVEKVSLEDELVKEGVEKLKAILRK